MRLTLDNAQNTPHLDLTDHKGIIQCQIAFCSDTILINGRRLEDYPEEDNIAIYPKSRSKNKRQ